MLLNITLRIGCYLKELNVFIQGYWNYVRSLSGYPPIDEKKN